MRHWLYCSVFPAFLLGWGFLSGQTPEADSSLLLPLVEVRESPLREAPVGLRRERFDSLRSLPFLSDHLGDLLAQDGGVYIKRYGAGSSASSSMRGGSAAHTSVLWNGLPIQNPMLGQADLSLVPAAFFDRVELGFGGQSAAWGSGAIGGLVSLDNGPPGREGFHPELRLALGSFGLAHGFARAAYGKGPWTGRTRMFHRRAENDFPFRVRPDLPERTLDHAAARQSGIMQEVFYQPDPGQRLSLSVWGQHADRDLPPTTVQNTSAAEQEDAFLRAALQWQVARDAINWTVRAGLFREYLDFRDPRAGVRGLSRHWLATGEASGEWFVSSRFRLHFGATYQWAQAETDGYAEPAIQNRAAPFLLGRLRVGAWRLQLDLRQEVVDGNPQPFLPGLAVEGEVLPWLTLRARVSRNFRVPTLNDLYWVPGGNPELRPENGWSQEAGVDLGGAWQGWSWSYRLTGYSRLIQDWMLWSPSPGQPFFSVDNITEVWSRGLEQRIALRREAGSWRIRLQAGLDLQRSTNQVAIERPALEAGEQLDYTPERLGFVSARLSGRRLAVDYRHRWTGPVNTLSGSRLDGYALGSLYLLYNLPLRRHRLSFFLRLQNIWNADYQVIEYRPMPGRSVEAGIAWALRYEDH